MKKEKLFVFTVLVWMGITFCSPANAYHYYKKGSVDNIINNLSSNKERHQNAYKKFKDFYDEVLTQTATPKDPAYLQLAKALDVMKNDSDVYDTKMNELIAIRDKMNVLYGSDDKIRSDQPNWDAFVKLNTEFNKELGVLNADGHVFDSDGQNFANLANKNGIKVSPVKELQDKIKSNISKLDAALADAHKKMAEAHEAFKKVTASKELAEKQKALDAMDVLIVGIEKKRAEIGKCVDLFNKRVAKMVKIYQGPGIEKITIFEELKTKGNEMNDLSHKFNDQAKKLK